jgi:hypothetical protein
MLHHRFACSSEHVPEQYHVDLHRRFPVPQSRNRVEIRGHTKLSSRHVPASLARDPALRHHRSQALAANPLDIHTRLTLTFFSYARTLPICFLLQQRIVGLLEYAQEENRVDCNHGVPLVSEVGRKGGRIRVQLGRRVRTNADKDYRYQSKLRTAPLLTQSITTAVRIPRHSIPSFESYIAPSSRVDKHHCRGYARD